MKFKIYFSAVIFFLLIIFVAVKIISSNSKQAFVNNNENVSFTRSIKIFFSEKMPLKIIGSNQNSKHQDMNNNLNVSELPDEVSEINISELNADEKNLLRQCFKLDNCYKEKCDSIPSNDPREYELTIGQKIKNRLLYLAEIVEDEKLSSESVSVIARYFLSNPDGHVKEAALQLISTQTPSEKNLESITKNILSYHDMELAEFALTEFQKYYLNAEYRTSIDNSLINTLIGGSLLTRESVSKNIFPFLTAENIERFESFLKTTEPGSKVNSYLGEAIDRFKLANKQDTPPQ